MTARPIDGAEGYALFLRHVGAVSLDEVNEYLRGIGLREVQPRMIKHYQKLQRYGYESYITQNRLDLAVAGESAWSEDMRAQYPEVRRSFDAELFDGQTTKAVVVERLGAVSASILDVDPPSAGRSVVLRLPTVGIERVGLVVRTDRASGRFHLNFDAYSSLPVAPADSPYTVEVVFDLPDEAESVVAVSDVLLVLERALTRFDQAGEQIVRISRLQMSSPLTIQLTGNEVVNTFASLAPIVVGLRLAWYQGTKTKREADGVNLDNELKRRSLQKESDRELMEAFEREESETSTPLMDRVDPAGNFKGEPESMTRRQFIEGFRSLVALPIGTSVEEVRRPAKGQMPPHGNSGVRSDSFDRQSTLDFDVQRPSE